MTVEGLVSFDFEQEAINIIMENSRELIKRIQDQMVSGVDADGNPLNAKYGAYYTDATIRNKKLFASGIGRIIDHVTNYLYGDFYEGMYIEVDGNSFYLSSNVPYLNDIIIRSGERALELNDIEMKDFIDYLVIPELERRVNS